MTTVFSLLCQVCGFSQREAATFLDARLDTVKSWSAGRNPAPPGVLDEMAGLAARIDDAADNAVDLIREQTAVTVGDGVVELGLASDDFEAQGLGWPCVGAHKAVLALTISRGMGVGCAFNVVPRGSMQASAAAADIHDLHR